MYAISLLKILQTLLQILILKFKK